MSLPMWNNSDPRADKPGSWRALARGGRRPLMRYVAVGAAALLVVYLFVYSSGPVSLPDYLPSGFGYEQTPVDGPSKIAGKFANKLPTPPVKPPQTGSAPSYPEENSQPPSDPPNEDLEDESYDLSLPGSSGTTTVDAALWAERAESVKQGFLHAYRGYEKYAWGKDELLPVSNKSINNFNGWGVTLFDSLDTMLIMGTHEEFERAIPFVKQATFLDGSATAPFFETTIRYLGGLLSAYALSNDPIMLQRADDLGELLSPVFNTGSGFPVYSVNVKTHSANGNLQGVLAEVASCQMEYRYLAHITGKKKYYDIVEKITSNLEAADTSGSKGLWPTHWNLKTGNPSGTKISIGALADSAYEYTLKQWLMTARTDRVSLNQYTRLARAIIENLIFLSPERKLMYVTDTSGSVPSHKHEHLSCYLPGLFALGVEQLGPELLSDADRELHLWAAEGLAYTCWVIYADSPTGIGADEVKFPPPPPGGKSQDMLWVTHLKQWRAQGSVGLPPGVTEPPVEHEAARWDYRPHNKGYHLRPETVEAIYLVWRATREEKWRVRGWQIWEALEKHTRTPSGYSSIDNVLEDPPRLKNAMPSYFLAETVKYLFLLFEDDDLIPLDHFVFNTEAHPIPVWHWLPWEVEKFDIRQY